MKKNDVHSFELSSEEFFENSSLKKYFTFVTQIAEIDKNNKVNASMSIDETKKNEWFFFF